MSHAYPEGTIVVVPLLMILMIISPTVSSCMMLQRNVSGALRRHDISTAKPCLRQATTGLPLPLNRSECFQGAASSAASATLSGESLSFRLSTDKSSTCLHKSWGVRTQLETSQLRSEDCVLYPECCNSRIADETLNLNSAFAVCCLLVLEALHAAEM